MELVDCQAMAIDPFNVTNLFIGQRRKGRPALLKRSAD